MHLRTALPPVIFLGLLEKGSPKWQDFIDLGVQLHVHFQPVGPIEEFLVEKIVVESLRYGRFLSREQNSNVFGFKLLCTHRRQDGSLPVRHKLTAFPSNNGVGPLARET